MGLKRFARRRQDPPEIDLLGRNASFSLPSISITSEALEELIEEVPLPLAGIF